MLLLQSYHMYLVIYNRGKTFFQNNFSIPCIYYYYFYYYYYNYFHNDSCIYWNKSQITESEKWFSIADKSSMILRCLKRRAFNAVYHEKQRKEE